MQETLIYHWQKNQNELEPAPCFFIGIPGHHSLPLTIRHEFYDQGSDTGLHLHEDFYALYVVQGGRGVHVINNHPYGIARGDVYLLSPGTVHAYRDYCALAVDAFYFQPQLFSSEELAALRSLAGFWHLLITLAAPADDEANGQGETHDHRLHLPPEHLHDVETMLSELCAEFVAPTPEAALLTHTLFFRLLVHFARWQAAQQARIPDTGARGDRGDNLARHEEVRQHAHYKADITNVLRICEERFQEPLTVPQLAAQTFLSPSRFTELFSREVGMSPAAYIRRLRLERAQTLLRTTVLSTTSIAHQVGFRDGAQLSRAFRDVFHLTPTAYRATFR